MVEGDTIAHIGADMGGKMKRIGPIIVAMTLVLSACQSASETIAEQLAEQIDGVNNVELDEDTGTVKIETDDETLTFGGGELPADFPIPIPDGGQVLSVFTSGSQAAATVSFPQGRYDELVLYYDDWSNSQPGVWGTGNSTVAVEGQTVRSSNWYGSTADSDANISVTDCVDASGTSEFNSVCVVVVTG